MTCQDRGSSCTITTSHRTGLLRHLGWPHRAERPKYAGLRDRPVRPRASPDPQDREGSSDARIPSGRLSHIEITRDGHRYSLPSSTPKSSRSFGYGARVGAALRTRNPLAEPRGSPILTAGCSERDPHRMMHIRGLHEGSVQWPKLHRHAGGSVSMQPAVRSSHRGFCVLVSVAPVKLVLNS